jgi:hypothetical protein
MNETSNKKRKIFVIDLTATLEESEITESNESNESLSSSTKAVTTTDISALTSKQPRTTSIPVINGWIIYDPLAHPFISINEFIETYNPAEISTMQCHWICVKSPHRQMKSASTHEDIQSLIQAWNKLEDSNKTQEVIQTLSELFEVVIGKWLIFAKPETAQALWSKIAKDVVEGKLGPSAKISTSNSKQHVICVYTENFTDEADVIRVRDRLREIGFTSKLNYKPDAYTYCDIYTKNPWNIRATRYTI